MEGRLNKDGNKKSKNNTIAKNREKEKIKKLKKNNFGKRTEKRITEYA